MKALASDFDNTLLFYTGMKKEDLEAIREFQKQGNLFGVCSGRELHGIINPSKDYDIHYDFYICNTGSYILDGDLNIIMKKTIPFSTVKEVFHFVGENINMSIVYNDQIYHINRKKFKDYHGIDINSLDELNVHEVDGFSFHLPRGQIQQARVIMNKIIDHFGDQISAFQNNEHIDICAIGCSKGEGIEVIKKYFHVNEEDMCAIGDSFNDLPMFPHVKYSFTFHYSDDEVKRHAKYIVSSIADCINLLLVNEK